MKTMKIIIYIIAFAIGILWLLPFLGVFMSSIRPYSEISEGWWHFDKITLIWRENFAEVWNYSSAPIKTGLLNSILITVPATILTIIVASLLGYALARFKFPLKSALFFLAILIMAMPPQSIVVPLSSQMEAFHLIDTRLGLILIHTAWGVPWCSVFMMSFFQSVPIEIEEAAKVDGASDLTIFRKIVLPLALPAIVSVAVLQFIWVWNDFFFALIFLQSPEKWVLTQAIPAIKGRYPDWSLVSAASILAMIVPLIVFICLQKYYIKGIMAGAVKE